MRPQDELPFMSFSVSDWISATVDLTLEAYAALHRLHCQCWRRAGQLPHDPAALARMAGLTSQEWVRIWPQIKHWFAPTADGSMMTIPTLEAERTSALELKSKRRRGASVTNQKLGRGTSDSDTQGKSHSGTGSVADSDTASDSQSESDSAAQSATPSDTPETRLSLPPSPSPSLAHPHPQVYEGNGHAKPRKRAAPFPDDFVLTDSMRQQALKRYPDCDVDEWFALFAAHHRAHGKTMQSWPAAWTTWIGNGANFGYPRKPPDPNAPKPKEEPRWR